MRYLVAAKMQTEDFENFPKAPDARSEPGCSTGAIPLVKYCMITPARDEEQFITGTIESVLCQTIRPLEWIIVDDGSTDSTSAIIDRYAERYTWIRTLRRENRGFRSRSGGVEAFLDAYSIVQSHDWEFLVNLDGDLTFAPDYFEKCFEHFHNTPRLGIGGGTIYDKVGERVQFDKAPSFHVRGGTKIYRRECWEKLGGLVGGLGWDTVDETKANQLGWMTQTFSSLELIHHRRTGVVWGTWGNAVNDGEADYIVGYHPLFFSLKCARQIFNPPYVVRGLGIAYGFLRGLVRRTPRIGDRELRAYLRQQQWRRLLGLSSIWK
ncbi:MAG TPA: glycosyltransferase family A protein [Candidatus Polarisedimenticolia bacterium]|nr:glycosyltransferase family A protein [Candidatus Polarisedimenticolia bacterium]